MHALMKTTVMDRLVARVAEHLYDPYSIDAGTLPLVMDDRPFAEKLGHDIAYDTYSPFALCLLIYIAIEDGRGDRTFWEGLAETYLNGSLVPETNLLYQFRTDPSAFAFTSNDDIIRNVEMLYEDTAVELYRDNYGDPMYYLNEMASEIPYAWAQIEPEYMSQQYESFFGLIFDHLTKVFRLTTLWSRLPSRVWKRFGDDYAYPAEYDAVVRASAEYGKEAGSGYYMPYYSNPYKGGGFTCTS